MRFSFFIENKDQSYLYSTLKFTYKPIVHKMIPYLDAEIVLKLNEFPAHQYK